MNDHKGSLTVEAACTFPLFLLVMILMMSLINAAEISTGMLEGLHEAGKQMAVYAYEGKADSRNILTIAYARQQVRKRLSDKQLPLWVGGAGFREGDQIIDLRADCRLPLLSNIIPLQPIYLQQQVSVRAWCGRAKEGEKDGNEGSGEYVYVTVNGRVFHENRDCTHIRLSIRTVDRAAVAALRNQDGGKYKPCESCKGGSGGAVYITDSGDRYHSTVGCSRLERTVLRVPAEQVADWPPCKRCGG